METMHVKMVFESYVVYVNGKEKLRTDFKKAATDYCSQLSLYFSDRGYNDCCIITTEIALAKCEVVSCRYTNNSRHGEKAGKTYYRVYVNDEFIKELSFKPQPMALINAIAPNLDWKKIKINHPARSERGVQNQK